LTSTALMNTTCDLIREAAPEKADAPRPFRLAVIQLGTYDGTVYNARQVVDKIGHLCDYILFDSAWVGYEQFIPMMADCSPLLLELNENDPGIFVTQSVHKQQAGFSQTSQIHKKDNHLRGQARFCPHKRLNNAFMLHASTSPFYPLFAALDVNAKIHEGERPPPVGGVRGAGHRSAQGDHRQLQNDPAVYSAGGGGAPVAGSSDRDDRPRAAFLQL
jgi:arginine/lysine/ornithine decarboxylase